MGKEGTERTNCSLRLPCWSPFERETMRARTIMERCEQRDHGKRDSKSMLDALQNPSIDERTLITNSADHRQLWSLSHRPLEMICASCIFNFCRVEGWDWKWNSTIDERWEKQHKKWETEMWEGWHLKGFTICFKTDTILHGVSLVPFLIIIFYSNWTDSIGFSIPIIEPNIIIVQNWRDYVGLDLFGSIWLILWLSLTCLLRPMSLRTSWVKDWYHDFESCGWLEEHQDNVF